MTGYDDDSSGDEGDYTQTNVLLGYASKDPTGDDFSQLGGRPTWLDSKPPSGAFAKCKVCNGYLNLLLQLNGDLPDCFPGHDRRLYLFGCKRKACRRKEGSFRGIRAVKASTVQERMKNSQVSDKAQQPPTGVGEALFGVKSTGALIGPANPFSAGAPSATPANPFSATSNLDARPPRKPDTASLAETFAQKARISGPTSSRNFTPTAPPESWPAGSELPTPYPRYHVDAEREYLEPESPAIPPQARVTNNFEGESSSGSADMKDAFESSMDKTFQRFADRLAQNPEQVLRYEFGGQPLLYTKTDPVGRLLAHGQDASSDTKVSVVRGVQGSRIPRCSNCGAERTFELQLTPHTIIELEADDLNLEGMDWGAVIFGACSADCVMQGKEQDEVGYLEEWVGVQWEELAATK